MDERRLLSAADALRHLTQGYRKQPEDMMRDALFDEAGEEPVIVWGIPFVSLCGEHLLPFHGHAHVAYLPGKAVVGLSQLVRLVDLFAHRLQTPSRLADEVARAVDSGLEAKGVAVAALIERLFRLSCSSQNHSIPGTMSASGHG